MLAQNTCGPESLPQHYNWVWGQTSERTLEVEAEGSEKFRVLLGYIGSFR